MINDALRPLNIFAEMAVGGNREVAECMKHVSNQATVRPAMAFEHGLVLRLMIPFPQQIAKFWLGFKVGRNSFANIWIRVVAGRLIFGL